MQNSTIIIFTRPIRSEKTTELFEFIKGKKNIGGFLTPDKNGSRMLYDIPAESYYEFELAETSTKQKVTIGEFNFSAEAFAKAKEDFKNSGDYDLYIIDEVGKLETLQGNGFEPQLTTLIDDYLLQKRHGKLLLVVRDTLLNSVIEKYGLSDANIIHSLEKQQVRL